MRLLVEGISHRYHGRLVLQDVSFAIEAGEIVCIIGPSGCGVDGRRAACGIA